MNIELLDIDYKGMSLIIKELRKLYEVGDYTTKRMIDNIINRIVCNQHLFEDNEKNS